MRPVVGAILLVLGATGVRAQTFVGRVLDGTDSLVVSGAQVQLDGVRSTRSNGLGQVRLSGFPHGPRQISVRMLGYAQLTDTVDFPEAQTVARDLYLTRVPRLLSQMVVKGKSMRVPAGFEDVYRRAVIRPIGRALFQWRPDHRRPGGERDPRSSRAVDDPCGRGLQRPAKRSALVQAGVRSRRDLDA